MPKPTLILIAAPDFIPALRERLGADTRAMTFGDSEPLRAMQVARIEEALKAYNVRKREIAASFLLMDARLDASRDALREFRIAALAAYRELRPEPFGKWLGERDERQDEVRSRSGRRHEKHHDRYQKEHQVHDRDTSHAGEFAQAIASLRDNGLSQER